MYEAGEGHDRGRWEIDDVLGGHLSESLFHRCSLPPSHMSISPSASTSHSRFQTILDSSLDAYKKQTCEDLSSHPLFPVLQSCDSADAILTVLREQIPGFGQTQSGNEAFSTWLIPTVNVLYALSATVGEGIGLVNTTLLPLEKLCSDIHFSGFSPAKVILAGISVLFLVCIFPHSLGRSNLMPKFLQAAKDVHSSQDKLVDLFNQIGYFFRRLEIYTGVPPTRAMTDILVEVMVEVTGILAIVTKEMKRGRLSE